MASTKKISLGLVAIAAVIVAIFLGLRFSGKSFEATRAQLLSFVPADATSVIFIDVDQLRASPFLTTLRAWIPHPAEDSDYTQFIADTGFNYEHDLSQLLIAVSNEGAVSNNLVLAQGKFDRKKIEAYLGRNASISQQGALQVFRITVSPNENEKPASLAFLTDQRIAISDSENLEQALGVANRRSIPAEWQLRFDRLAGSPLFAVIRQDPAVQTVLAGKSPQLANFINQLPWITLAAKPEGDILRVVAEGETLTDAAASQLSDFLQGIQLLAQTGLNDANLRQSMNPEERDAYVQLVKETAIEKVNRSDRKTVRVIVPITPQFLKIAKVPYVGVAPGSTTDPPRPVDKKKPSPQHTLSGKKN